MVRLPRVARVFFYFLGMITLSAHALSGGHASGSDGVLTSNLRSCQNQPNTKASADQLLDVRSPSEGKPDLNAMAQLNSLDRNCFDQKLPFFAACERATHPAADFLDPTGAIPGPKRARFPGDEVMKSNINGMDYYFVPTRDKLNQNTVIRVCTALPCSTDSVVALMNDYSALDQNGKVLSPSDGFIDQVQLSGQVQFDSKDLSFDSSKIVKIPLNQDRAVAVADDGHPNAASIQFQEMRREQTVNSLGLNALAGESSPGQMCRGNQGDPAKLFAYMMKTTGWNPKNTHFKMWHKAAAFYLAQFQLDTYSNTGRSLMGLGEGVWDGTAGVVGGLAKGVFWDLPKAFGTLAFNADARNAFTEALGDRWTKTLEECRKDAQATISQDHWALSESAAESCAIGRILIAAGKLGGKAIIDPIMACLKNSMNSTPEGAQATGKCIGQAAVLAFATIASAGAVTGGRATVAQAASLSEKLEAAGRMTPMRQAIITGSTQQAKLTIYGATAAGETMGLGHGGTDPMEKVEKNLAKIVKSLDKLSAKNLIKAPLSPEQVETLSKYLRQVAQRELENQRRRSLGLNLLGEVKVPDGLTDLIGEARLRAWVADTATIAIGKVDGNPDRANPSQSPRYNGDAGQLAKIIENPDAPATAQAMGEKMRSLPQHEIDAFVTDMKNAETHDRQLAAASHQRAISAVEGPEKELQLKWEQQLTRRADIFHDAWETATQPKDLPTANTPVHTHADNPIAAMGASTGPAPAADTSVTEFLTRQAADPHASPAQVASTAHQMELKEGFGTLEQESLARLGISDEKFENLRRADAVSDFGKQLEGLEIWKPAESAESLARSNELIGILSGRTDSPATRAIASLMKDMGYEGKWLLPPNLDATQIRSVIKDSPVLISYLHEMPGIEILINQLESGKITEAQFKEQLKGNLFHNGPNIGFWKDMSDKFVPGGLKSASTKNPAALDFFKGTVFDGGDGKIVYPNPQGIGVVHATYDRLSQGTGGGMIKILKEIDEKGFLAPAEIIDEMVNRNPRGTLDQLVELDRIVRADGSLGDSERKELTNLITNAKERMPAFQQRIAARVQVIGGSVVIDGVKYTNDEKTKMFDAFEKVVREVEYNVEPIQKLDQAAHNPVIFLDKNGRPLTKEQIENGQLSATDRRIALKKLYGNAGFTLDNDDLYVLVGVHDRGKPIGHQDFGSIRTKLTGSDRLDDPGYLYHFKDKLDNSQFRNATKQAMDNGLLGSLPIPTYDLYGENPAKKFMMNPHRQTVDVMEATEATRNNLIQSTWINIDKPTHVFVLKDGAFEQTVIQQGNNQARMYKAMTATGQEAIGVDIDRLGGNSIHFLIPGSFTQFEDSKASEQAALALFALSRGKALKGRIEELSEKFLHETLKDGSDTVLAPAQAAAVNQGGSVAASAANMPVPSMPILKPQFTSDVANAQAVYQDSLARAMNSLNHRSAHESDVYSLKGMGATVFSNVSEGSRMSQLTVPLEHGGTVALTPIMGKDGKAAKLVVSIPGGTFEVDDAVQAQTFQNMAQDVFMQSYKAGPTGFQHPVQMGADRYFDAGSRLSGGAVTIDSRFNTTQSGAAATKITGVTAADYKVKLPELNQIIATAYHDQGGAESLLARDKVPGLNTDHIFNQRQVTALSDAFKNIQIQPQQIALTAQQKTQLRQIIPVLNTRTFVNLKNKNDLYTQAVEQMQGLVAQLEKNRQQKLHDLFNQFPQLKGNYRIPRASGHEDADQLMITYFGGVSRLPDNFSMVEFHSLADPVTLPKDPTVTDLAELLK